MQNKREDDHCILLAATLIALATIFFILFFYANGPSWDLIAHYFNGRSLLNPVLYNSRTTIIKDVTVQGSDIYYEAYRAPLSIFIFTFLYIFNLKSLLLYLLILYAAFVIAIYKFSKDFKTDLLLSFAVLLNIYVLSITFTGSSEEILSIIFVLISMGLLLKKSPWAGFVLGIAGLAKYTSLILLPTVLLLQEPKKIVKGIALEILATIPWLLFNFILTGNSIISYIQSYSTALSGAPASPIYIQTLVALFAFPLILLTIYLIIRYTSKPNHKKAKISNAQVIIGVFLILSIVQFLIVGFHYDAFTQERYGYLVSLMASISVLYLLNEEQKVFDKTRFIVAIVAIILFIYAIYNIYFVNMGYLSYYNPNSNLSVYNQASSRLKMLGYANCSIISNSWIYMRYLGYNAYMPFYSNNTKDNFPIVVFNNLGVNASTIDNINSSTKIYSNGNFSIYLPSTFKCYT